MSDRKKEKGDRLWFKAAMALLPKLVTGYFKLVDLTSRKIYLNQEREQEVCQKRAFSVAGFHGTSLWPAFHCRRYGGVTMVSRSFDGDLGAACVEKWGYRTARGSSSRMGKEALRDMIEIAKENNIPSGLAVDAPRGPARKVKIGIVILARETGQPVVPMGYWTTRHIQFNSWDRMILPLPFSTIVMGFGKSTEVPEGLSHEDYESIRQEIEDNLLAVQLETENKVRELKQGIPRVAVEPMPTRK